MNRLRKNIYTDAFKLKAVRLVDSGRRIAEVARSLAIREQTLRGWIRARKIGTMKEKRRLSKLTSEQTEIRRLRAEVTRLKMERAIVGRVARYLSHSQR